MQLLTSIYKKNPETYFFQVLGNIGNIRRNYPTSNFPHVIEIITVIKTSASIFLSAGISDRIEIKN